MNEEERERYRKITTDLMRDFMKHDIPVDSATLSKVARLHMKEGYVKPEGEEDPITEAVKRARGVLKPPTKPVAFAPTDNEERTDCE